MVLSYYLVHYSTINFVIAELCWTELVHSNSVTWKFWRRSMSKCLEETLSGSYLFLIILTSENKWITSLFRLIFPTTIHFNTVLLGQPKSTLLNLIITSIIISALPRWSCRKHNTPYGWKHCWDDCGYVYILVFCLLYRGERWRFDWCTMRRYRILIVSMC